MRNLNEKLDNNLSISIRLWNSFDDSLRDSGLSLERDIRDSLLDSLENSIGDNIVNSLEKREKENA